MTSSPPRVCPDCGARDGYAARYTTGGGWRRVYRCRECGRRAGAPGPTQRVAPLLVVGGAVGTIVALVRRRFRGRRG